MSNMQLSDELVNRVRTAEVRAYLIAQRCGVTPSQLSAWVNRITPVRADDPRVLRLAELMDVETATAFEPWCPARDRGFANVEFRGR